MNIKQQWSQVEATDDDLAVIIQQGIPKKPSKDPIQKIKRNLLANSIIGFIIAIGYVVIIVKFAELPTFLCIGLVLLFTLWASVKSLGLFVQMSKPMLQHSVLQQMQQHYTSIQHWMKIQQQVGLFVYPVAAAGGFMVGGSLSSGKSISIIMQKPIMPIAMVIVTALLVPLCYKMAKWMCKKSFGKYANQLKQNIESLQSEQ